MCDLQGLGSEREEVGEEENTISWSCSYDGERRQRREGGVPSPQTIAGSWEDEGKTRGCPVHPLPVPGERELTLTEAYVCRVSSLHLLTL